MDKQTSKRCRRRFFPYGSKEFQQALQQHPAAAAGADKLEGVLVAVDAEGRRSVILAIHPAYGRVVGRKMEVNMQTHTEAGVAAIMDAIGHAIAAGTVPEPTQLHDPMFSGAGMAVNPRQPPAALLHATKGVAAMDLNRGTAITTGRPFSTHHSSTGGGFGPSGNNDFDAMLVDYATALPVPQGPINVTVAVAGMAKPPKFPINKHNGSNHSTSSQLQGPPCPGALCPGAPCPGAARSSSSAHSSQGGFHLDQGKQPHEEAAAAPTEPSDTDIFAAAFKAFQDDGGDGGCWCGQVPCVHEPDPQELEGGWGLGGVDMGELLEWAKDAPPIASFLP